MGSLLSCGPPGPTETCRFGCARRPPPLGSDGTRWTGAELVIASRKSQGSDRCISPWATVLSMSVPKAFHVLIVEDDVLVAAGIEILLSDLGYQSVGPATTFEAAIGLAAQIRPELALVDIHLADGLTGVEVARHLVGSCGAVVLFVTASRHHIPEDYAGACGMLAKPYSDHQMRAALQYLEACICSGRANGEVPYGMSLSPRYTERWLIPSSSPA